MCYGCGYGLCRLSCRVVFVVNFGCTRIQTTIHRQRRGATGNEQTIEFSDSCIYISASIHIKEDYLIPCEEMSIPIFEVRNIVISESEITEPEKIEQQTWWGESEGGWESTDGRPLLVSQRGTQGGGGQLGSSPGRRHRDVILNSFYPYRQRPEAEIHI